jgi:DeoR/GlpR family transcriptional regulator of sugar metabolism
VEEGDSIYLEAGSTCYEMIPYLAEVRGLTVIVNSLYLMTRLGEMVRHKVVLTGGEYGFERMDLRGALAESAIGQLGGFKAFTSADDISVEGGLSGGDVATVGFTKLVLKRAAKVYFLGDHTKFDHPVLYKIGDIDLLDAVVTDRQPNARWMDAARQKSIRMIYPREG